MMATLLKVVLHRSAVVELGKTAFNGKCNRCGKRCHRADDCFGKVKHDGKATTEFRRNNSSKKENDGCLICEDRGTTQNIAFTADARPATRELELPGRERLERWWLSPRLRRLWCWVLILSQQARRQSGGLIGEHLST